MNAMQAYPAIRPLATRPRHEVEVWTDDAEDEAALEAALLGRRIAREKGLPRPISTSTAGGRIEVKLLFPHMPLWADMFTGLGFADEREHRDFDAATEDIPERRVQAVPSHRRGDFSVHGWTEVEDGEGGTRKQQWVLRPVMERDCQRCIDLPETRQPLSVEAWFEQRWWDLTGRRWDQPSPALESR